MHSYFISYYWKAIKGDKTVTGFDNNTVRTEEPITSMKQVQEFQEALKIELLDTIPGAKIIITIINWKAF